MSVYSSVLTVAPHLVSWLIYADDIFLSFTNVSTYKCTSFELSSTTASLFRHQLFLDCRFKNKHKKSLLYVSLVRT